jgi:hypothetical protein
MSIAYKEQQVHEALPATSHDELARQHFVRSFKEHLGDSPAPRSENSL